MKISIYQKDMAYRTGGAESYAANVIQALQELCKDCQITLITEKYSRKNPLSAKELILGLNEKYGTSVSASNIDVNYIRTKETEILCSNKFAKILGTLITEFRLHIFQNRLNRISRQKDFFISSSMQVILGRAKKNIAIIHFPHDSYSSIPIYRKLGPLKKRAEKKDMAYKSYDRFLPNSEFTASYLKKIWKIDNNKINVLNPPVVPIKHTCEKKDQILICSRIEKTKKIEELIRAFLGSKFLSKNFRLVICGSTHKEDPEYIKQLEKNFPEIEFVFNPSRRMIEMQYAQAKLFWHARGFEEEKPELFEHFGITTVEAMSAGCIPVVINKGGQAEIVTENCGFTWDTLEALVEKSEKALKNKTLFEALSKNAIERSKIYYYDCFKESLKAILNELT